MAALKGRVALVTGGSRGIGQAIAVSLADAGAAVAVNYLERAALADKVAEAIHHKGGRAIAVGADVSQAAAVKAMVSDVEQRLGPIDILVNNAGITRDNLSMRMGNEEWDQVIAVNLTAAFRLSRALMRGMMKKRWGRIVSITSVVGVTGNPGQSNYAAAKAGLVGMTKSIAAEVASRNITVNCVAPGFVVTPMTDALTEDQKKAVLQRITAGRFGSPDDIAAAVVYLASNEAGYVTGQTLHVNGGMAMIS